MAILAVASMGALDVATAGGAGATTALIDRKLWDTGNGTPVFGAHPDAKAQHYGLHSNLVTAWRGITVPGAPARIGIGARLWKVTNAATAAWALFGAQTAAATYYHVRQTNAAGNALQTVIPAGNTLDLLTSPAAATSYWVDVLIDVSGTTHTMLTWINGVLVGSHSIGSLTATTIADVRAGNTNATGTGDWWVSDLIAYDYADGPMGEHYVWTCRPNACGTHSAGAAGTFTDDAAAQVNTGETTSFSRLDEAPANTTDYVRQVVANSAAYLEYALEDVPKPALTASAVRVVAATFPIAAQTANELAIRAAAKGTATAEAVWDNSVATGVLEYHTHTYPLAPDGSQWVPDTVDDLRIRGGYSNDVSPVPAISALLAEVAVPVNRRPAAVMIPGRPQMPRIAVRRGVL